MRPKPRVGDLWKGSFVGVFVVTSGVYWRNGTDAYDIFFGGRFGFLYFDSFNTCDLVQGSAC